MQLTETCEHPHDPSVQSQLSSGQLLVWPCMLRCVMTVSSVLCHCSLSYADIGSHTAQCTYVIQLARITNIYNGMFISSSALRY